MGAGQGRVEVGIDAWEGLSCSPNEDKTRRGARGLAGANGVGWLSQVRSGRQTHFKDTATWGSSNRRRPDARSRLPVVWGRGRVTQAADFFFFSFSVIVFALPP